MHDNAEVCAYMRHTRIHFGERYGQFAINEEQEEEAQEVPYMGMCADR